MAEIFGVRISKPGKNVFTDAIKDMALDSRVNMLKVHMAGYGTQSVTTAVTANIDVTHNLGYRPIVYFYFEHPENDRWHLSPARVDSTTGTTWDLLSAYDHQSVNTVRFKLYDGGVDPMPSSPTNVNYKYFILVDPQAGAWDE
jgi:hypothetical protein